MDVKTISASRIASVLGMSPWATPLALYHQLRGELPEPEDNEVLKEGRYFEDAIAKIAAEKYGFEIVPGPSAMEAGFLSGHPDRWFQDSDGKIGVLEIKNTFDGGGDKWGEPGTDDVPRQYWMQCQVYAFLAKSTLNELSADYVILAARLYGGVAMFKIHYDAEVVEKLQDEACLFLRRVSAGDPPSPQDEADMRMRWLVDDEKVAVCDEAWLAHLRTLQSLKEQKKDIEAKISEQQAFIIGFAQDAGSIAVEKDGQRRIVATLSSNRSFDEEACLKDNPDLLARYPRLDTKALQKAEKLVYEAYMRKPKLATQQTRTLRIKDKELA